ncbi:MAG: hypothetical protein NVSMB3_05510 [Acidobacteriaceae bacterium]
MIELHEVSVIDAPIRRCFDLARSVQVHLRNHAHAADAHGISPSLPQDSSAGLVGMGQKVTWCAHPLGLRQTLTTRITAFDPPSSFQDTMLQGAFRSLQHDHFFRPLARGRTEMTDIVRASAPLPILGPLAELLVLRFYLRMLLLERSALVKQVAESEEWMRYLPHS